MRIVVRPVVSLVSFAMSEVEHSGHRLSEYTAPDAACDDLDPHGLL